VCVKGLYPRSLDKAACKEPATFGRRSGDVTGHIRRRAQLIFCRRGAYSPGNAEVCNFYGLTA